MALPTSIPKKYRDNWENLSLKQRKYLINRYPQGGFMIPDFETCDCGGKRNVRDHGTWIGYYCPKCKGGGSYSKPRKRR